MSCDVVFTSEHSKNNIINTAFSLLYFVLGGNLCKDFLPIVEKRIEMKVKPHYTNNETVLLYNKIQTIFRNISGTIKSDIDSPLYKKDEDYILRNFMEVADVIPKPLQTENTKSKYIFLAINTGDYTKSFKIKWRYENFDLESILIMNTKTNEYMTYHKRNEIWYLFMKNEDKKIGYATKGDYIYFKKIIYDKDLSFKFIYSRQRNDKQDYINYKCKCNEVYGWENFSMGRLNGVCWFVSIMMIFLLHPDMRKVCLPPLAKKSKMDVSKLFACKENKTKDEMKQFILSIYDNKVTGEIFGDVHTLMKVIIPDCKDKVEVTYGGKIVPPTYYTRAKINIYNDINPTSKIFALMMQKSTNAKIAPIREKFKGYTLMGIMTNPVELINGNMSLNNGHAIALVRCSDEKWYIYDDNTGLSIERIPTTIENNIIDFKYVKYELSRPEENCRSVIPFLLNYAILFYVKR